MFQAQSKQSIMSCSISDVLIDYIKSGFEIILKLINNILIIYLENWTSGTG